MSTSTIDILCHPKWSGERGNTICIPTCCTHWQVLANMRFGWIVWVCVSVCVRTIKDKQLSFRSIVLRIVQFAWEYTGKINRQSFVLKSKHKLQLFYRVYLQQFCTTSALVLLLTFDVMKLYFPEGTGQTTLRKCDWWMEIVLGKWTHVRYGQNCSGG